MHHPGEVFHRIPDPGRQPGGFDLLFAGEVEPAQPAPQAHGRQFHFEQQGVRRRFQEERRRLRLTGRALVERAEDRACPSDSQHDQALLAHGLVIAHTHASKLPQVLADWALPAEALAEEDEVIARLKAGDHSDSIPQDELGDSGGGER
ncbi:hypothetical protein [Streptomyces sp. NBC_00690]|uniref:hypothetical protein n=1 Tax=Streptomyces sp. NBC_00690 TaxID=2975808 RepID=UPI002E2CF97A|nr:hypothetical protein [Streptomyces sp. NBC_00690]